MILLKSLVGSKLHGLDNEKSDFDWKSINISPLKEIISPFRTQKGKDSVSEMGDNCIYEFKHFAKLMNNCNPSILEVLWSNNIEYTSPLAEELIAGRKKLLDKDKIFQAHRGYAHDQRHKMFLTEPKAHRTSKAICAYIRIMLQGISLLDTGDFNPVVTRFKKEMLEIKYNFNPLEHIPLTESLIGILEDDLVVAYEGCTLEFNPDIDWLEDLLLRTYVKLG